MEDPGSRDALKCIFLWITLIFPHSVFGGKSEVSTNIFMRV